MRRVRIPLQEMMMGVEAVPEKMENPVDAPSPSTVNVLEAIWLEISKLCERYADR